MEKDDKKKLQYEKPVVERLDSETKGQVDVNCTSGSAASISCIEGGAASVLCLEGNAPLQ